MDLIRLHHSDSDSFILAQLVLSLLKKKNVRNIINKIFNKSKVKQINNLKLKKSISSFYSKFIPVYISGLYFYIGGRLMREPIIPRITSKKFEKGSVALGKVNSLEQTQMTSKNRKGAYTIKISFAQNILN